jgi:hypothetical protein
MPHAVATDRFVIRTASGDKGPFSRAQIAEFVAKGKLPATAKILDVDAQRAVTAGEVIAVTPLPEAPDAEPAAATPAAGDRIDEHALTPAAPGTRIPTGTARTARGATGGGRARTETSRTVRGKRRSRGLSPVMIAVIAVAVAALLVVVGFTVKGMKTDHAPDLAKSLLADALAHPDAVLPAGAAVDPAYVRTLVQRYHAQALADAKQERGSLSQYKPGYDETRYRESLRTSIGKQVATPDAAVLNECARGLVTNEQATATEIAAAKTLAQQAVAMDGEKNHNSLITLAWAFYKFGDAKRAALIGEQAMEIAPTATAKAECGEAIGAFRTGKAAEKAAAAPAGEPANAAAPAGEAAKSPEPEKP